ncbi:MAG: nitroreductase family protein [Candidatus Bathyarchaeota archaeon]|jgi:nitroreductase|nr:nitroreductase family protein [Candidatus Bathyarchaeota archaeon]
MESHPEHLLTKILERKSIRKFKSKKVSKEHIKKIVKAGQRAPTACKVEAYSFILISDQQKRTEIMDATVSHQSTRQFMMEAPVWIVICTDYARHIKLSEKLGIEAKFETVSKFILGLIDASLAAENMTIAAEALGLASCFVGSIWTAIPRISEILNVPKNVLPFLLLCIGYPDEIPAERVRWPIEAILHENTYSFPTDEIIFAHSKTRKKWETSSPYRLNKETENRIYRDLAERGFMKDRTTHV